MGVAIATPGVQKVIKRSMLILCSVLLYHKRLGERDRERRNPRIWGRPIVRLGIGEAHSGDLVVFGYFNWNARVYRLDATEEAEAEWATLVSHGFKLGGGLGGSGGLVAVFAHGVENVTDFNAAFAWGDMDFNLAIGGQLGGVLKGLSGIGKVVKTMEKYKKLSYAGLELLKNKAFIKKGVYVIPIPLAGAGVHVWVGRKYATTSLANTGTGL